MRRQRSACMLAGLGCALSWLVTTAVVGQQAGRGRPAPPTRASAEAPSDAEAAVRRVSADDDLPSSPAQADDLPPNHVLVIRFSEALFDGLRRPVDRTTRVRRRILGTDVQGLARTTGKVEVEIAAQDHGGSFVMHFRGAMRSNTAGRNGPAVIYSDSTTRFHVAQRVVFDARNGFRAGPFTVRSTTRSRTDDIAVNRGGLIGRIIQRVAWRRVNQQRAEADRIANGIAQQEIGRQFSATLQQRLAEVNQRDNLPRLIASLLGEAIPGQASLSSTHKYLQLSFQREAKPSTPVRLPEQQAPNAPIEIWMHASLIGEELPEALSAYETLLRVVTPLTATATLSGTLEPRRENAAPKFDFSLAEGWFVLGLSRGTGERGSGGAEGE